MPKTLFDKLWDAHIVSPERDSAPAVLYVDLHLIHEVTSPQAFAELDARGLRPRRADLTKATRDHSTPTLPAEADGRLPYVSADAEAQVAALRRNCARHGIELFTYDSHHPTLTHGIASDLGLTPPGQISVPASRPTPRHCRFRHTPHRQT